VDHDAAILRVKGVPNPDSDAMHHPSATPPRRRRAASLEAAASLSIAVLLAACAGGDAPTAAAPTAPTPVAQAPVASISLSPATAALVPGQAVTLTATPRDAAGTPLTGRPLAWSSSAPTVATVSPAGLVTAVASGTATVTVTSEGRSASASITVSDGALIGPTGGTVVLAGGAVMLTIPAGALTTPTPITATPRAGPPPATPSGWRLAGPFYDLGPDGTTFAQPVTVTLRLDPAALPEWAMTGDLGVLRQSHGQWSQLADLHVDVAAGTVSGTTTGFSGFGIGVNDPPVTVAPAAVSVNDAHRMRQLRAVVAPRGTGVPRAGEPPPLRYRWRTSGQAGVLWGVTPNQWTTSDSATYIATEPALRLKSGRIDGVFLDLLLNPESLGDPAIEPRIHTVEVPVDADLAVTYDILPALPRIDAGTTVELRLVARDKQGATVELAGNQAVEWQSTDEFGTLTPSALGAHDVARFASVSHFTVPPPRVDRVVATVRETNRHFTRVPSRHTVAGQYLYREEWVTTTAVRGVDTTFVEVHVDYRVSLTPAQATLKPFGRVTMNVQLSPAYDGPGLKYRFRKTGSSGALDVPVGTLSDAKQVTFEANADGDGTDVVTVDVVSVVAGTEVAQLGSAEARLTVDKALLRPVWRFTSLSLISSTGAPAGNNRGLLTNVIDAPGDYLLHVFPTVTAETMFWGSPLAVIQKQVGSATTFIASGFAPSGAWIPTWRLAAPASEPSHEGEFEWTGDLISGTLSGFYRESTGQGPTLFFRRWAINATKDRQHLTGTIRLRELSNRNIGNLVPYDHLYTYSFTAELVID
jgi:hypothetical protein